MVKVKNNLTGKAFGRLTVISQAEDYMCSTGKKQAQWNVSCECSPEICFTILGSSLKNGRAISCGCYRKEYMSKTKKKYNKYFQRENYMVGTLLSGEEFFFDIEDYSIVKKYYWDKSSNGYIVAQQWNNSCLLLHRLVMKAQNNETIDHIFHNLNDNRKSKLRIATQSQQNMNQGIWKNNTSGVKGVCWYRNNNKWVARITINYKTINLGYFDKFEDAVYARQKAEKQYFKDFRKKEDINDDKIA